MKPIKLALGKALRMFNDQRAILRAVSFVGDDDNVVALGIRL